MLSNKSQGSAIAPAGRETVYRDIDRAIALYWRTLAGARGLEHHAANGAEWVTSLDGYGPERVYHLALPEDGALDRLRAARAAIVERRLPNGILFTPNSAPANLLTLLADAGFAIDTSGACMVIGLNDVERPTLGEGITIEALTTDDALAEWADIVNTDLFGVELLTREQFADLLHLPKVRLYLARYNGVPAAACMTIADGELAVLEMVATRAQLRRRGIAAALVRTAMADLRDCGAESLQLRSEPEAIAFYEALGFRTLGRRIVATVSHAMT